MQGDFRAGDTLADFDVYDTVVEDVGDWCSWHTSGFLWEIHAGVDFYGRLVQVKRIFSSNRFLGIMKVQLRAFLKPLFFFLIINFDMFYIKSHLFKSSILFLMVIFPYRAPNFFSDPLIWPLSPKIQIFSSEVSKRIYSKRGFHFRC